MNIKLVSLLFSTNSINFLVILHDFLSGSEDVGFERSWNLMSQLLACVVVWGLSIKLGFQHEHLSPITSKSKFDSSESL